MEKFFFETCKMLMKGHHSYESINKKNYIIFFLKNSIGSYYPVEHEDAT